MPRDYYSVLGVPRTASEREIRSSYRRLARKYHPDLNRGDILAAEKFKEANQAHEILSDPEQRRLYDRYGHQWEQGRQFESQSNGMGMPGSFKYGGADVFRDFASRFGRGDLYNEIFRGPRGATDRKRVKDHPEEYPVELSLEEVIDGAVRTIKIMTQVDCSVCNGEGTVNSLVCGFCSGNGRTQQPITGEVKIPAGLEKGARVTVTAGGRRLSLIVSILGDPRFQRKGYDLYSVLEVPLYDALLGGEMLVPIVKGSVVLTLPPETSNGRVFRLTGQGIPKSGDPENRGTLFVTINVVLPVGLTETERDHFRHLRALR